MGHKTGNNTTRRHTVFGPEVILAVFVLIVLVGVSAYLWHASGKKTDAHDKAADSGMMVMADGSTMKMADMDTAAIKQTVVGYADNAGVSNAAVKVDHEDGKHALGTVQLATGSQIWYAAKTNGSWRIVAQTVDDDDGGICRALDEAHMTIWAVDPVTCN